MGRTILAERAMQVAVSILSPVNIKILIPPFLSISNVSHTFTER